MNLPNNINGYRKYIENEKFTGTEYLDYLIDYYNNIPLGALEEIIVGYDNYNYRGILRVSGRGNDLRLVASYEKLLDDGYGSFSSNKLESVDMTDFILINSVEEFLFWFGERAKNNLNKTGLDRYVF